MTLDPHASRGAPDPTLLDAQALAKLRELDPSGTQGVVARVLRAYEQSLSRFLVELEAARASRDTDTLARIAHTLKSSSASVGALALSKRCAQAEKLIREQNVTLVDAELDSLMQEGALALGAVRAMLEP